LFCISLRWNRNTGQKREGDGTEGIRERKKGEMGEEYQKERGEGTKGKGKEEVR
jgi:hypothetical protein